MFKKKKWSGRMCIFGIFCSLVQLSLMLHKKYMKLVRFVVSDSLSKEFSYVLFYVDLRGTAVEIAASEKLWMSFSLSCISELPACLICFNCISLSYLNVFKRKHSILLKWDFFVYFFSVKCILTEIIKIEVIHAATLQLSVWKRKSSIFLSGTSPPSSC